MSAGQKAGIRVGDKIIAMNGKNLKDQPQAYIGTLIGTKLGDEILIDVQREGKIQQCKLVVEENARISSPEGYFGVHSNWLAPDSSTSNNSIPTGGEYIEATFSGDPASDAGIKHGDIIVKFDNKVLTNNAQFTDLIGRSPPGKRVAIELLRDRKLLIKEVTIGKRPPYSTNFFWREITGSALKIILFKDSLRLIISLIFFIIGVFLGWKGIRDTNAFQLSFFFMGMGNLVVWYNGMPLIDSWDPFVVTIVRCISYFLFALILPLLLRVLSVFPAPTRLGNFFLRWQWVSFLIALLFAILTCTPTIFSVHGFAKTQLC